MQLLRKACSNIAVWKRLGTEEQVAKKLPDQRKRAMWESLEIVEDFEGLFDYKN